MPATGGVTRICWVKVYAFDEWMCIYTQDRDTRDWQRR